MRCRLLTLVCVAVAVMIVLGCRVMVGAARLLTAVVSMAAGRGDEGLRDTDGVKSAKVEDAAHVDSAQLGQWDKKKFRG